MSRPSLRLLLQGHDLDVLRNCAERWCGTAVPSNRERLLAAATAAMEDGAQALHRVAALPRKLQDLLEPFFGDGGSVHSVPDLLARFGRAFKSRFELDAALAALQREGFLFPAPKPAAPTNKGDAPCWAAPGELVAGVLACRRHRQSALKDVLTLQGYLDARHFRSRGGEPGSPDGNGASKAADHARKIYKLYTMESAIEQRLGKLPSHVGRAVDLALQRHGGLVSFAELQREQDDPGGVDADLLRKCLEECMLGTVAALPLARCGIQPVDDAVVVFHEVALHAIRRHGERNLPMVSESLSCGVDLVTNVGRFLRELQSSKVLFTAEGDLFKASQKRIAGLLLPIPGDVLSADAQLELLYRFCLHRRLIDRRGERALRPTPAGLAFDRAPLQEQVKLLLLHFVEDRSLPGEPFHQTRLRRLLLRLLRRAEPLLWQDVSILPFLTRNAYLAQLDTAQTEEFFAARFQGGGYTPTEGLQQLCWNLLTWVKKRLYPLGLVDIGRHGGRPVALRLSKLGAELLEAETAAKVVPVRSTIIVNPDFEIVLFPGDDEHDAVHAFDRFSRRIKSDQVHIFRLERAAVRQGLDDGLSLAEILQELNDRARVPIPQNVLYSLEDWAGRG